MLASAPMHAVMRHSLNPSFIHCIHCSLYCCLLPAARSQAGCKPCGLGTFTPSNATVNCAKCALGSFQDAYGRTSCRLCAIGSSAAQTGAQECPLCQVPLRRTAQAIASHRIITVLCCAVLWLCCVLILLIVCLCYDL
jgi:hypothetical protein